MSGKQRLFAYFSRRRPRGGAQPQLIGSRYRLLSVLGRGGMGTVWLADDTFLHRQVAVKELRVPGGLTGAELRTQQDRALREARSAARIRHANAVTLFDAIAEDGAVYLIMELVEGVTLKELTDRHGRLPTDQVARYGLELLDVLAAAHALGIVHRDVKPGNIMITSGGQVKLSDFGLAHTVGDPRLTSGGVMGTQAYLAPELFENAPVTPAADLWSLGATLYDAAVGRGPFDRETIAATLRAIVVDDPPVPRCAPALAAAITGLLRRDPQERATIEQARRMLRLAAEQLPAADSLPLPPASPDPWSAAAPAAGPGAMPAAGSGLVSSAGPVRKWKPDEDTGIQPSPLSAGIAEVEPRVSTRRAHRFPGGHRAPVATTALATVAVIIAAALVLRASHLIGGPGTPSTSPSASAPATKPKPSPTVRPTLPPPTRPSGTPLYDGQGTLGVTAVAFSSDGNLIATGDGSGTTYLWDPATHRQVGTVDDADYCQRVNADNGQPCKDSSTRGVNSLAMYGDVLATADQNGFIYRWSTATANLGQPVSNLLQDPATIKGVLAIAYDPTGHYMATGDGNGNAYLWTGGQVDSPFLPDHNSPMQPVTAVAFSPDGTVLAAGDMAGTTNMWSSLNAGNPATNRPWSDPQGGQVNSLAFGGPGGKLLAVGDADGNVCLYQWRAPDTAGNCFWNDPNGAAVTAVAFNANGTVLAIGDSSGDVYLYSLSNPAAPRSLLKRPFSNPDVVGNDTYLPNLEGVSSLAFDQAKPTGMLAVGDADGSTYLWPMNWLPQGSEGPS